MKELQKFAKMVDVIYLEEYPNNYEAVLRGDAYWNSPINILGYYGKFAVLGSYIPQYRTWEIDRYIDTDHPKCYYCGKFVRKGDWWRNRYTGNCTNCYERIPRW